VRPAALVTGANRGIGRGIAWALAQAGFDVVVADLARTPDTEATLEGVRGRGGAADFIAADIAAIDGHAAVVDAAWALHGRIDCLVNNAGVSVAKRGDMLEVTPESFDRVVGVNLRGTFFLTQAVARRMLADPPGEAPRTIVTVTSSNAEIASPERSEYCIAKAGLAMMVRALAVRLAPAGILVYDIRPGLIRTDMTSVSAARYDRMLAEGFTPISRWGEPGDVGQAVAMVAGGGLRFSTGEAIHVDGGMHIHRY
jgi:3-oxoacyl-[acyl-carrier protein] reductase